jgi:hypothetical protein
MSNEETTKHCVYDQIAGSIHRFTIAIADRQAMDEFIPVMADIFDTTPPDETVLLLIDFRPDGIPPLRYAVQSLREMIKDRETPYIRAAYLHEANVITSLITTFLDRLRLKSRRKLFTGADVEDEALSWLLSDER